MSDCLGIIEHILSTHIPIDFCCRSKLAKGMRLDPNATDPVQLGLKDGGARPAEWVEERAVLGKTESIHIAPHQMRRIGEHKTIPLVNGPIPSLNGVRVAQIIARCHPDLLKGGKFELRELGHGLSCS